ncbi:MAG TPA: group II truncated hemoglobin [Nevskiaceae bacterium]|nr:group II truncated hemoglobin [Nevskiaceae bacterium]
MSSTTADAPRLFDRLGGEPGLRALVDAFYDRMETEPAYARLRALHPPSTAGSRDKLFWFLCGWSGGPPHFVQRFGHPRLRARHLPYAIGETERDQWLACFAEALDRQGIDPALRAGFWPDLAALADWMRNQ